MGEGREDRQGTKKVVRFCTYNIWSGRNGGLELALRRMAQGKVDCGVMHKTKLIYGIYTIDSSGFRVTMTAAPISHCGGVAVFYCEAEHFVIEELRLHGPKVIRFQLVTGRRRWHIMGFYIAPSDASTIEDVVAAIRDQPCGDDLLVAGGLNANLEDPEGTPR